MTDLQKLQLRASAIRARMAELGAIAEQTDETRGEIGSLRTEYQDVETRATAMMVAGDTPKETVVDTPENRELAEIRNQVKVQRYLASAVAGHGVIDGPELEYNQALGMTTEQFPMNLLTTPDSLEERAAVDGDAQTSQQTWIDRLFADAAASHLGITMPSVPAGIGAYPVTTGGDTPLQRGRGEAKGSGTFAFNVTEVKPSRGTAHIIYSVEDAARVPGFSDAITRDLSATMVAQMDKVIFVGDTGANEAAGDITGLQTLTIAETTVTQAQKVKGDELLKKFLAYVDGIYATSLGQVNIVATVGSNTIWGGNVHNSTASNQTVAGFLRENGVSWVTKGDIESNSANGDFGAFIGLQRGIMNAGVAPIWEAGSFIRDVYTGAAKGEVGVTLVYLWNFVLPRGANFKRLKYVT